MAALPIANCITDFWQNSVTVNYVKEEYIDDLRIMLHFFAHREFITMNGSAKMLSSVYVVNGCKTGDWINVDGNLMRVRIFKNGNVHFEIHPDVAWKLNEILAYSMPAAIPAPYRTKPKSKAPKEFGYIQKAISHNARIKISEGRYHTDRDIWFFDDLYLSKRESAELECILTFIGGEKIKGAWKFPYDAKDTVNKIVATGVVPDVKTHQFYPTPSVISNYIATALELKPGDTLLEPSAGRGDLLTYLDVDFENITCIEIAPLFVDILRNKGYNNTICADFIEWATDNPGFLFDKIVMNPPYSCDRYKTHTLTALDHLKVGGRLVVILPGNSPKLPWVERDDCVYAKGKSFTGEFADTGITVSVYVFKRVK
ncbi:DUF4942 domain-containing protein [Escherichia ruysiae]|uniref:DUF4942 domain-containing protein n=1 Tax=Escherichia ruysiae TaxID=2608867 RepID=UPI002570D3C3|nr:DUF4942 domain-containing protein [Escherichia ruysiae]